MALKGKKSEKKIVFSYSHQIIDPNSIEYTFFEMFNYKIRQKKIDFFKITNPYPALKQGSMLASCHIQDIRHIVAK